MTQPDYETYRNYIESQSCVQSQLAQASSTQASSTQASSTPVQSGEDEYFTSAEIAEYLDISVEDFFSRAAHADLVPLPAKEPTEGQPEGQSAGQFEGEPRYAAKDVRRFLVNIGVLEGESQW